jgi:hypothetical protein
LQYKKSTLATETINHLYWLMSSLPFSYVVEGYSTGRAISPSLKEACKDGCILQLTIGDQRKKNFGNCDDSDILRLNTLKPFI